MAREIKLMNWKEVQEAGAKYYYTVKLDCMYADTVGGSSNDEFKVGEDVIYRVGEGWYNGVVINKTNKEDKTMKEFNYVDTDSVKASDEMAKGIEKGLEIRARRSLLAGAHNVDVRVDGETIRATHEVSELRKFSGDPLNGNYTAVYATTEDGIFLFVRVKEWCDVYSMEFGEMEDY